jgi:hypothetical protein
MVGGRRVNKPWGHELWWSVTDLYAGKILHIEAGHRLSLQYHRTKDESCYLVSGRIRLVKGVTVAELETVELEPGASWRNLPLEIHTIEAIEASDVFEVSTPQMDDVVRLLDDYGRVPGTTEKEPDVVAHREDQPLRLLDRDLVAAKLRLRRDQVMAAIGDPTFPAPAGYFRGRVLWEEAAVDAWQTPEAVELHTASS